MDEPHILTPDEARQREADYKLKKPENLFKDRQWATERELYLPFLTETHPFPLQAPTKAPQSWSEWVQEKIPQMPQAIARGMSGYGSAGVPEARPGDTPEETRSRARRVIRHQVQEGLPLAASALMPPSIPLSAATVLARSPLWNLVQAYGPAALNAIYTGIASYIGTDVSNRWIDPEHKEDPGTNAVYTGGGNLVGGVGGHRAEKGRQAAARPFAESPQGQTVRETLEQHGGTPTLGLTTKNPFARGLSDYTEHQIGGGRLRNVREHNQQVVNDALERVKPSGGQVSEYGLVTIPGRGQVRSTLDLEAPLRPVLPVQKKTTLDVESRLRPHFPMGSQQDLEQVPRLVQRQVSQQIDTFETESARRYLELDRRIQQTPVDIRGLKASVKGLTIPPDTQLGVFGGVQRWLDRVRGLPDTLTLDGLIDLRQQLREHIELASQGVAERAVTENGVTRLVSENARTLQEKVLPRLNQLRAEVESLLEGRLVDISWAKGAAQDVLASYEGGLQLPEASLMRGQTGRQAVPQEDPHILWARAILEQPDWVPFSQAHRFRSQALEISRQPGPTIGNTIAKTGERFEQVLKNAMTRTADKLGGQGLVTQYRDADRFFFQGASKWNSPLLKELKDASLDDILTRIVRNERPEDLKLLHEVLGDDLWGRVGDMWLHRIHDRVRDPLTWRANPQGVLGEFEKLTPVAEKQLFGWDPKGPLEGTVAPLKRELRRSAAMEEALHTDRPERWQDLVRQMPLSDVDEVAEIRLSGLIERNSGREGVLPRQALGELQLLEASGMAQQLWGKKLPGIRQALEQAEALQLALTETDPLLLREYSRRAGPYWDQVGDIRLSKQRLQYTDPTTGKVDADGWLTEIQRLGAAEKELYGTRLTPLKDALGKVGTMQRMLTGEALSDPTVMRHLVRQLNDPHALSLVQADWLLGGFGTQESTRLLDGRKLLEHLNSLPDEVRRALFPDPRVWDELHHLGETAMILATKVGTEQTFSARHYPRILEFLPGGGAIIAGVSTQYLTHSPVLAVGAGFGALYVAPAMLARVLTNPRLARWVTTGMHTSVNLPQAGRIVGTLVGALEKEGWKPEAPPQQPEP